MTNGIIKYKDGSKYEGFVKNTKIKHGQGKMYNPDGTIRF
jgi:hypothetical protein